jgi:sugar phosphate isomerase/epimerase
MYVGILTGPFSDGPLEVVSAFAAEYGFQGLEVVTGPGSRHLDTRTFDAARADEVKALLEMRNLQISGLAAYTDVTHADPERRKANVATVSSAIDIAHALGVEVVCTMAGLPPAGKDRHKAIEEDCAEVFPALIDKAGSLGIKLALENWTATNIQNLAHWEQIFTVLPAANFGLNFDPSHLYWQGIDYLGAVDQFASRIFHSHGKDTEIRDDIRQKVGYLGNGWWRYVIPGLGRINWGEYISALRRNGYNGVISIEHEDSALEREEGFLIGKKVLEHFIAY